MTATRQQMLAALAGPLDTASLTAGKGLYRRHYAQHGAAFWGDSLARGVERHFGTAPAGHLGGKKVLDLGAGTGRHAFEAARLGAARVDAVEIDAVAAGILLDGALRLEQAGITGEGTIRLHAASAAEYVTETSAAYDLVICYGLLHALAPGDAAGLLDGCARLLQPGGTLILQFLTARYPAPDGQPELENIQFTPQAAGAVLDNGPWDITWSDTADISHSHAATGHGEHRHGSQRFLATRC